MVGIVRLPSVRAPKATARAGKTRHWDGSKADARFCLGGKVAPPPDSRGGCSDGLAVGDHRL